MSSAEKRQFKLHLTRNAAEGTSHQAVLFDAIAGMDAYDERSLIDRFKHEAFTHHFAITKRRLYTSILRCLETLHVDSSIDARLYRSLHHVELLHRRALYDDASKILHGVRRGAEEHERHAILFAVGEWKHRLLECRNYAGFSQTDLDVHLAALERTLGQQGQLDTLWGLKSKVFLQLYRQGQARDSSDGERLRALIAHPVLQDPAELGTSKARFLAGHVNGAVAFALGNAHACHDQLLANLQLLETHRTHFSEEPNLVIGVLSNLVYVCIQLGRYAEAFGHLKRFRLLPSQWEMPESDDLDLKLFSTTTSLELSIHLRLGDHSKALEMVPVVERGLSRHRQFISSMRRAAFSYQLAYAHFMAGQHEKALARINDLLNEARVDDSSDTVRYGRMLQLLVLLELGKADVLRFTLRNTERFLKMRTGKHKFEPLLLLLVRSLSRKMKEEEKRSAIAAFRDGALELERDPFERAVFDHFDLIAWAESKLSGESFAAHIKRRMLITENAA